MVAAPPGPSEGGAGPTFSGPDADPLSPGPPEGGGGPTFSGPEADSPADEDDEAKEEEQAVI